MTTIQVQSQLPFEKLLESLEQLNTAELAQISEQAAQLHARRRSAHLPKADAQILERLGQEVIPSAVRQRCAELTQRARGGTITPAEQDELNDLVDQIELLNAERIRLLMDLARLRNVSLQDLMADLEIGPLSFE
jgi:hypothetical protein